MYLIDVEDAGFKPVCPPPHNWHNIFSIQLLINSDSLCANFRYAGW